MRAMSMMSIWCWREQPRVETCSFGSMQDVPDGRKTHQTPQGLMMQLTGNGRRGGLARWRPPDRWLQQRKSWGVKRPQQVGMEPAVLLVSMLLYDLARS